MPLEYYLTLCFHWKLKHYQLNGLDFPNYHRSRFYSLEVTAIIKKQWFCTDLISNTHKDSRESQPHAVPTLAEKSARCRVQTVLSASRVIQFHLNAQYAYL